jgi:hypothetical protein
MNLGRIANCELGMIPVLSEHDGPISVVCAKSSISNG